ncbi:MAG: hypothetical protein QW566_08460, partial [Candidatus Jordarchaeales archaeon]
EELCQNFAPRWTDLEQTGRVRENYRQTQRQTPHMITEAMVTQERRLDMDLKTRSENISMKKILLRTDEK